MVQKIGARQVGICSNRCEMVRLERESSNSLFEVLEEWNTYLKQEDIDLTDISPKPAKRQVRGPSL